jgi:hypothetical protein
MTAQGVDPRGYSYLARWATDGCGYLEHPRSTQHQLVTILTIRRPTDLSGVEDSETRAGLGVPDPDITVDV